MAEKLTAKVSDIKPGHTLCYMRCQAINEYTLLLCVAKVRITVISQENTINPY